jgi:hypothetical protein
VKFIATPRHLMTFSSAPIETATFGLLQFHGDPEILTSKHPPIGTRSFCYFQARRISVFFWFRASLVVAMSDHMFDL